MVRRMLERETISPRSLVPEELTTGVAFATGAALAGAGRSVDPLMAASTSRRTIRPPGPLP